MRVIFLALAALAIFAAPVQAGSTRAEVMKVPASQIPVNHFTGAVTVPEGFIAGPGPKLNGKRMAAKEILSRIVPAGWRVECTAEVYEKSPSIKLTGDETWIGSLETYHGATGDRFLVNPNLRTVYAVHGGLPDGNVGMPRGPVGETWTIIGGRPVRGQLDAWCRQAGYTLLWEADSDFIVSGSNVFSGPFEKALNELFDTMYRNGRLSLKANIYRGNRIVRVRKD